MFQKSGRSILKRGFETIIIVYPVIRAVANMLTAEKMTTTTESMTENRLLQISPQGERVPTPNTLP
ncbi:hypothetical protein ACFLWI_06820 [Chloroflexota bacterium]